MPGIGQLRPKARLRAGLVLDSTEAAALELELDQRFGVKVDLWDATDCSLGEPAALTADMDGHE